MDNLKVVIVDDEYLVRELIKRSISWDQLGLTVSGEASGAMEALDLINEKQPDIVITDICMPIIDGIKLSSLILEKYPQINIIVLTGHDEFYYAKESISLGIKEYLLKPINADELKQCLIKLTKDIREEKVNKDRINTLLPYLKDKTLNDLMFPGGLGEDILENISRNNIEFKTSKFSVALVQAFSSKYDLHTNRLKVYNTIKDYFTDGLDLYCFLGSRGYIVLLNHTDEVVLEDVCERILNNILNRLEISISIGVGNEVFNYIDICNSYDQASKALDYRVIEGKNSVITFNNIDLAQGYDSNKHNKLIKELTFSIKTTLEARFRDNMDDLFRLQIKGSGGDLNSIRVMAANIVSVILSLISELALEVDDIFTSGSQPYENVFKLTDLLDIKDYLFKLGVSVIAKIRLKNSNNTSKLIDGVKIYVENNLSDTDLQLSSVALKFNVNSSYLSRKFKQETDETFKEFLAFLRIEKAILLLKTTDKRSYEIAEDIGISDPHYFSIFFKKQMNMSISDYKKELKVK
ncbi:MAG: response regulator [Spirochaetaceae bacterium]